MNRMVRDRYPVERLPDDLRETLDLVGTVRVIIEADGPASRPGARAAALADLVQRRKTLPPSRPDAVARVRALRDEWDQ